MKNCIIALLYFAVSINSLIDFFQTKALLIIGYEEANPIMDYFIDNYGINSVLYIKIGFITILGLLLLIMFIKEKKGVIK